MSSRDTWQAAAQQRDRRPYAPFITLLARRIAAGHADASRQRDPDFIGSWLQAGLDRLSAERPRPVLLGSARLTAQVAARVIRRAGGLRPGRRSGTSRPGRP